MDRGSTKQGNSVVMALLVSHSGSAQGRARASRPCLGLSRELTAREPPANLEFQRLHEQCLVASDGSGWLTGSLSPALCEYVRKLAKDIWADRFARRTLSCGKDVEPKRSKSPCAKILSLQKSRPFCEGSHFLDGTFFRLNIVIQAFDLPEMIVTSILLTPTR